MHRFFVPPEWIDGDAVAIKDRQVHQLRDVLRMSKGDRIVVLDNTGWEYEVELETFTEGRVEGAVRGKRLGTSEPATKLTLYQALLKGDRFELVLQKCTELGVVGFVPVLCERCVQPGGIGEGKLIRWHRVIAEAAEQSRRAKLPFLQPAVTFERACQSVTGFSLLAWEGERSSGLRAALSGPNAKVLRPVNLLIGPEGGFSPSEVEFAQGCGITPVSLGRRVLRAETASLVAAAAILYEYGDLDLPD